MADQKKTVRVLSGKIVSDKMTNTVTVLVERRVAHPIIGKVVRRSKKYHAHHDNDICGLGDVVEIQECKPISRTKSWKVTRLIEKSKDI